MRIGLLTVPFNNNFGGFLQAYALKNVLKNLGHEVIFINRRRNRHLGWKSMIKYVLSKIGIFKYPDTILSVNTNKFIQCYLTPGTPYYYTSKALRKCLKYNFDYCIVGSDQVWRYIYAKDSIDDFFFSFLKNNTIPRMSYGASFGTNSLDEYPEDKKKECAELLTFFSGLSVREDSGVKLLEELGVKKEKITVVLDPTLLLTKQHYLNNLIKDYKLDCPSNKYIFNYILDNSVEKEQLIEKISQSLGYEIIRLKAQTGDFNQLQPIAHVEEWLYRIYYADYVITDSFHGTVFSILFNKQFIVIGNLSRGLTRFQSLLKIFHLENRLIISPSDFDKDNLYQSLEWEKINKILERERTKSLSFLSNNIKNIQSTTLL